MRGLSWLVVIGMSAALPAAAVAQATPAAALPAAEGSKLALTLSLDKGSYAIGDEAYAEVRLENGGDKEAAVRELQLETRSVVIELSSDEKSPPIQYTVSRPNVFFNTHAGPTRVPLASKKALVTVIPVPLVRAGKVSVKAVYHGVVGADGKDSPLPPSNAVSVEVKADAGKELIVRIETTQEMKDEKKGTSEKGVITVRLDPESAPVNVMNFIAIARQGFYNDQSIFRVIRDFMIHAGCPQGTGYGDPGWNIANEYKPTQRHTRGAVCMIHPEGSPDAAGSQFFICVKDAPWLDLPNENYTVFGRVVEGLEVAEEIARADADPKTNRPNRPILITRITVGAK